jgi:hypothetical protein
MGRCVAIGVFHRAHTFDDGHIDTLKSTIRFGPPAHPTGRARTAPACRYAPGDKRASVAFPA